MDGFCDYPRHRDGPLAADDLAAKGGLDGSGELAKERPRLSRPARGEGCHTHAKAAFQKIPVLLCRLKYFVYCMFLKPVAHPLAQVSQGGGVQRINH